MNRKIIYTCLALSTISVSTVWSQTKKKVSPKKVVATSVTKSVLANGQDSLSYALGVDLAGMLKDAGFNVNMATLTKGLSTAYKGDSTLFSKEENMSVIQRNVTKIREEKTEVQKSAGNKFLAEIKSKPNIVATPEGLLYEVLVQGQGEQPTATDEVKVHYAGYLSDGTKFDSSYDRGEPLDLNLDRVIKGWQIAVPLMKVGSKYKLYIPQDLGYGERESGPIPAYSALVFEIELLGITKKEDAGIPQ